MAIYHLRATMISRSAGRSATAAAAYRSAARIEDARTGLVFDYQARGGVEHVETLAPEDAPAWVQDRSALWNAVEAAETRKNSQVAREIRVALPAELDGAQRAELVRGFAQGQFVARGMVADIALHAPGREGDDRNHHAHILLTTREIGPEGFGAKNRDWNAVEVLEGWREAWAVDCNAALERAGTEARVDHRTLAEQRSEAQERATEAQERGDEAEALRQVVLAAELDRTPLPQLSAGAWQLKQRGIEVAAVRAWHEVRAQAVEVRRVAEVLAGQVREWIGRAVERVAPGAEMAAAGLNVAERGSGREPSLAERLRVAVQAREGQGEVRPDVETTAGPSEGMSLAERLRSAAKAIDHSAYTQRGEELRPARVEQERHRLKEAEPARERGQKGHAHDDDEGWGH